MLVTTAMIGERRRNVPSLSSASATRNSPCPSRAFVPSARSLPPTTTVGSSPASRRTVPEQRRGRGLAVRAGDRDAVLHAHQLGEHLGARDHRDLQLARAHHLGIRERHRRRDDHHVDALVDVRRVVHAECDAARRGAPAGAWCRSRRGRSRTRCSPRVSSTSAMPLIPMPPMPTKWTRRFGPFTAVTPCSARSGHPVHPTCPATMRSNYRSGPAIFK